jgi:hypothetical protein
LNQHHPQQPQDPYNQPYNPQQGWGIPPQAPQPQPEPPKKRSKGKMAGLGCVGVIGLFVFGGIVSAIAGGGSDTGSGKSDGAGAVKPAASASSSAPASKASKPAASKTPKAAAPKPKPKPVESKTDEPKKDVVTFKVWGTAPAGVLGPLDINYGSDSDSRTGTFKNGTFTATLPLDDDAMYYNVSAQLQGSGDIQCSVTVDGKTKKAHASGDYNICSAQLSGGIFGGWE